MKVNFDKRRQRWELRFTKHGKTYRPSFSTKERAEAAMREAYEAGWGDSDVASAQTVMKVLRGGKAPATVGDLAEIAERLDAMESRLENIAIVMTMTTKGKD